nr:hypothetical protein [Polynucleobacter necessarius]
MEFNRDQVKPGENRRLRGEDLQQDKPAIAAGRLLRPSDLGLAASLGIASVQVKKESSRWPFFLLVMNYVH